MAESRALASMSKKQILLIEEKLDLLARKNKLEKEDHSYEFKRIQKRINEINKEKLFYSNYINNVNWFNLNNIKSILK